jgi:chorismate mutase
MTPTISPVQAAGVSADGAAHATSAAVLPGAGGLPGTDIRSAGDAEVIPLLRTQIDAIDAGIARLIAERARLSRRIQAARIAAGGVRVELGRERLILEGYRAALGEDGIGLGTAVLRLCRGPL